MRFSTKILGSVAVAGIVATGGSAFTAAGLTLAGGQATRFVGGTVSQNVVGATLETIVYGYFDQGEAQVSSLTLTFTGADTKSVSAVLTGGLVVVGIPAMTKFTCSNVTPTTGVSTCTFKAADDAAAAGAYIPDLTKIDVTVS